MPANVPKPTFDTKFQTKLVRVLFQFPDDARGVIETIVPDVFDTMPMRWVVRKLKWYIKKFGTPATTTVLEHEAVKAAQLGLIQDSHIRPLSKFIVGLNRVVPDRTYILEEAHKYVRYAGLREFVISTAEQIQGGNVKDWDAIDKALDQQLRAGDVLAGGLGQRYFEESKLRIKRRKSTLVSGIPTGTPLDEKLRHGGIPPKQIAVIIAPPGRGKTAALCFMSGSAIIHGKCALYVSLELDEDMIAERHDARLSGIHIQRLTKKPVTLRQRISSIKKKHGGDLVIKYFPPGSLSVNGLRSYVRRLESIPFYPDIIFLDYADNMDITSYGGGGGNSDYNPLGRLYIDLRRAAGELNIPIWTASQSNRLAMDKKHINLQHLADSFKKAHVADFMVAICQDDKEKARRLARLFIAKNRNGPTGDSFLVKFDTGKVQIRETA